MKWFTSLRKVRYLSTYRVVEGGHPNALYQTMQKSWFFAPEGKKYSIVCPYYIITDGHDILGFVDAYGQFQIGLSFQVEQTKRVWRSKTVPKLDIMFDTAIKCHLLAHYKLTYTEGDQQKEIATNDLSIHSSELAVYSSPYTNEHNFLVPIFFVIVPNNKPIHMERKTGLVSLVASVNQVFKEGLALNSTNYLFGKRSRSKVIIRRNQLNTSRWNVQ